MINLIISLVLMASICSVSNAADTRPEDVLDEMRLGLPKLALIETRMNQYECLEELKRLGVPGESRGTDIIKRYGDGILVNLGGLNLRFVVNDDSAFAVEYNNKSMEWKILTFERSEFRKAFHRLLGERCLNTYPLTAFDQTQTVADFINDPTFKATSAKARADGQIELGFSSEVTMGGGKSPRIKNGVITVDPKFYYIVTAHSYTFSESQQVGFLIKGILIRELDRTSEQFKCKSIRVIGINVKTNQEFHRESLTFTARDTPVDPAEFTLDYYKIPIPNEAPEDKPKGRWPWWATAGIVCIALSLVLGFYARYRSRTGGA